MKTYKIILPVLTLAIVSTLTTNNVYADNNMPCLNDGEYRSSKFGKGLENKASLLEITVEEIQEARANGKTMLELMEEKGITQEEYHNLMVENAKKRMQERGWSNEDIENKMQIMQKRYEQSKENGNTQGLWEKVRGFFTK